MKSIVWKKISHPAFLLGLILVLAFVLRVMHLEKESIWWDEYATHVHLSAPTLKAFLANNRTLDPMALPLYYSLEYGVAHYISANLLVLRALSVFLGLATIAALYQLGKNLFGTRAGLVAAMLTALSPVHIYHAQGIRMYGLFALLALLTVASFVKLLEKRNAWYWFLHLLCAAVLYWSHPFSPLVTAFCGLFLLVQGRSQFLLLLRWSVAHFLLLLPVAVWIFQVSFWASDTTERWLSFPTVGGILADVFFDDITAFQWQFRLGSLAESLGSFRWIPDLLLAVLILSLLGYWLWTWRQKFQADSPTFLLFLWLLLPPLMLLVLSATIRPCMFPRYTLHCSFALYLLLSGALSLIENRRKALLATLLLLCLSACQTLWLYPGPQRTDWFSVASLLQEKSEAQDLLLIRDPLQREVLLHNYAERCEAPFSGAVASAESSWVLAAQSALALGIQTAESGTEGGAVRTVLSMDFFVPGPPLDYEFALNAWGIEFERWFFPAACELYVYELHGREESEMPQTLPALLARWEREGLNYEEDRSLSVQAFGSLVLALAEKERAEEAKLLLQSMAEIFPHELKAYRSLQRHLQENRPLRHAVKSLRALYRGYGYRKNGHHSFAIPAFQEAIAHDPENSQAYYELTEAYFTVHQDEDALKTLQNLTALGQGEGDRAEQVLRAVEEDCVPSVAWRAEQAYRAGLSAMEQEDTDKARTLLEECLNLNPAHRKVKPELAYLLLLRGELDGSKTLLENYLNQSDAPDARALGNLAQIEVIQGNYEKAAEYSHRAKQADPEFAQRFGNLCRFFFEEQNFEEAYQELLALKETGIPFPPIVEQFLKEQSAAKSRKSVKTR